MGECSIGVIGWCIRVDHGAMGPRIWWVDRYGGRHGRMLEARRGSGQVWVVTGGDVCLPLESAVTGVGGDRVMTGSELTGSELTGVGGDWAMSAYLWRVHRRRWWRACCR